MLASILAITGILIWTRVDTSNTQTDVSDLQNATITIGEKTDQNCEDIVSITVNITDIETDLDTLDSAIQDLSTDVDQLNTTVSGIEEDVDELGQSVDQLNMTVSIIEENVSDLNDTVQELVPCSNSTCSALLEEVEAILFTPGTTIAYISSTGTVNPDCSLLSPCTLDAALEFLSKRSSDVGQIHFHPDSDVIDLGATPTTDFYPAISRYGELRIQGVRRNLKIFTSASAQQEWGPYDQWSRLEYPMGSFSEGEYDTFFGRNLNRFDMTFVVYNTTTDTIDLIHERSGEAASHDREFWTSNSTFTWSGIWKFNVPFGVVSIDSVIIQGSGSVQFPLTPDHRVKFSSCHLGVTGAPTYVGSFKATGCYSSLLDASGSFSDGSTSQCISLRSLWIDTALTVRGACDIEDFYQENGRFSVSNGVTALQRFINVNGKDGAIRINDATSAFLEYGVIINEAPGSGSLSTLQISKGSQASIQNIDIRVGPIDRKPALRVETASQLYILGDLRISGASIPITVEEASLVTIQATVLLSDYTIAGVYVDSSATLVLWLEGTRTFTWEETLVDCIRVFAGSNLLIKTFGAPERLFFNTESPNWFLRVQTGSRITSNFFGNGAPVNNGTGPLLSFCGNGNSPWEAQSDFGATTPQYCIMGGNF